MTISVFVFIALAVFFNCITKLLDRYVVKDTSPYAFSWLTQITASLIFLPLAYSHIKAPPSGTALFAILVAGILWTCVSLSVYISIKKTEISIKEPLSQSKLIWALLLGVFILGEPATSRKILGTVIIFVGMSILLFHPERRFGRLTDPGVLWTMLSALFGAAVAIVDKFALGFFKPELYGFFVYLIPGIIFTCFLPAKIKDVQHLWKTHGKIALTSITLSTASYYFVLKAYSLADVTLVYPLLQLATIFAVVIGILFMGEREHKWQKIAAVIIAVVGAIIVKS